jgi:hypothetical protein
MVSVVLAITVMVLCYLGLGVDLRVFDVDARVNVAPLVCRVQLRGVLQLCYNSVTVVLESNGYGVRE